jgi:hypothetical protein
MHAQNCEIVNTRAPPRALHMHVTENDRWRGVTSAEFVLYGPMATFKHITSLCLTACYELLLSYKQILA